MLIALDVSASILPAFVLSSILRLDHNAWYSGRTLPVSCGPQEKMSETAPKPALWAVSSSGWLGAGEGRETVFTRLLHRHLPLYSFSSFFSSLKKRQLVPWA